MDDKNEHAQEIWSQNLIRKSAKTRNERFLKNFIIKAVTAKNKLDSTIDFIYYVKSGFNSMKKHPVLSSTELSMLTAKQCNNMKVLDPHHFPLDH